jgi:hypothetical protein
MRRSLKSLWLVPALLLGACGPTDLETGEAPETLSQGVLHAPPTPASGNVLDSTTFMGNVAIPGSVQTRFTTNPQYFSFSINARAGAQAKLEVTHLGSSMYLDTGLFVYGPKSASGSYGTTVLAQDDDAGYGQLSKLSSVTFTQGGEYLVVVSTGTGAGKQFRLQLDCLSGNCNPVDPSVYATCDRFWVGPPVEECMSHYGAEGVPLEEAFALCFGADDAHHIYQGSCYGYPSYGPVWCQGGEAAWTQRMWPVCVDRYTVRYGNYSLSLSPYPVSAALQAELEAANTACGTSYNCYGELRAYSFPWSYAEPPHLEKAVEAVSAIEQSYALYGARTNNVSYASFVQSHLLPGLASLHPDLVTEFGNGTEEVQVARYVYSRELWPDACQVWTLNILFFPQSHRVLAFEQDYGQDC